MIIGITGNMGSGKSTVGNYIRDKGYLVLDADYITRLLYQKGKPCYTKIVEYFGESVLDEHLEINRKKLGQIIFSDETKKKWLEELVHKEVLSELKIQTTQNNQRVSFWEVPLLYEAGWENEVDIILYIASDYTNMIDRVMKRDEISEDKVKERLSFQKKDIPKLRKQDFLIKNTGTKEDLFSNVDDVLYSIFHCE